MLSDGFFKKLTYWGLKNYYKRSDGDAIGLIAQGGQQLKYHPIVYKGEDECEEGEKPGWHAVGSDKSWEAGSEGRVVDHLGRTPIVLLERDAHIEAGWLKPRIGEAIELDRYDPVFSNAQIDAVFDVDPGGQPPQQAAQAAAGGPLGEGLETDGGQQQQTTFRGFEIRDPGMFAGDSVIDLSSQDGHDGIRISHSKADEWMSETTTSQEMQMQEDRGYLKGQADAGKQYTPTKVLLIAAAIILGVLGIVLLGPSLVGGAGGGASLPSFWVGLPGVA